MTKDDVLVLLEQADAPVSGEQMCKTLGLTRAAVWKAIEALRADGYEIEAATRRGYFLCTCPLTKSALEKRLLGMFVAAQKKGVSLELNEYSMDAPSRNQTIIQVKQPARDREKQ